MPGLAARRIFADLGSGATSQLKLVEQAHAAGMLPVISYKVGGDVAGAVSGQVQRGGRAGRGQAGVLRPADRGDVLARAVRRHDRREYIAASKQLLPIFKRGKLRVGPILNGWLLDRQQATFASYAPDELFELWDWFGIDTYESGHDGVTGAAEARGPDPGAGERPDGPRLRPCRWGWASTTATAPRPSRRPARR